MFIRAFVGLHTHRNDDSQLQEQTKSRRSIRQNPPSIPLQSQEVNRRSRSCSWTKAVRQKNPHSVVIAFRLQHPEHLYVSFTNKFPR